MNDVQVLEMLTERLSGMPTVDSFMNRLTKCCEVYIVGGFVRDLIVYGKRAVLSRDLDIVVNVTDWDAFYVLVSSTKHRMNRFGGYKIYMEDCEIDLWELKNSFGIEKKNDVRDVDFLNSMRLNIDKVVFNYTQGRGLYRDLESFISDGTIDMKIEDYMFDLETDYVLLSMVRCYYYKLKYYGFFSEDVIRSTKKLVVKMTFNGFVDRLMDMQMSHFKEIKINRDVLERLVRETLAEG